MTFKYFDRPDKFTSLKEEETICDFCKQEKICFSGESFRGSADFNSICPECLKAGKLLGSDSYSCNGDIKELKRQIKALQPSLSDQEVEQLAQEKTEELERTTPHLVTWQDWFWPCADGDYCQFIGFGSKPLYKQLAKEKMEKDFFMDSIYYDLRDSDLDYLWEDVLPEKEIKDYEASNDYGALFYVFKSLESDKVVTIWDCN
ncbi:CbrC family protein [Rufibacter ruber]|uniref:CbrC family protein n=1 Tax=Rufibacter ruber TaxID=1783499 RepID=UPI00082BB095|nr:CbrC family protein [Rufibacter ruber]